MKAAPLIGISRHRLSTDRTASRDQLDLSASGASDKFKYYVSAGLLSDKGIIQNSR